MKRGVLAIVPLLSLTLMSSCASTQNWSETDRKLARLGISRADLETSDKIDEVWQKNVQEVLYIGMPEEIFLQSFTRSGSRDNVNQPYILETDSSRHRYVMTEIPTYGDKYKGRVTFVNGMLVKYEQFGRGENPWGYTDCTFLLQRHN